MAKKTDWLSSLIQYRKDITSYKESESQDAFAPIYVKAERLMTKLELEFEDYDDFGELEYHVNEKILEVVYVWKIEKGSEILSVTYSICFLDDELENCDVKGLAQMMRDTMAMIL